ncbi:MAG: lipoyl synthase [Thaumarchaeota archaeon]|nr:MAG: lipoyl synthase [Nitrososphaerota archaeon]
MKSLKKPPWIKVKLPAGEMYSRVRSVIRKYRLHTVCDEALCPNISECWGSGTATIMLLGDVCTRACKFCAVKTGNPRGYIDRDEPKRVAEAVKELNLDYVVLTSVTRDDLEDGGASIYAEAVRLIKEQSPKTIVEVLIPDFNNDLDALKTVVESGVDVVAHNIETVERLTPKIRDPRAGYWKSLRTLKIVKDLSKRIYTKSSIMLGLGEKDEEVIKAMRDLRSVGVDILTIGQYLQPTKHHLPVVEYVTPEKFEWFKEIGVKLGFLYVASGPLVRSSYRAGEYFIKHVLHKI